MERLTEKQYRALWIDLVEKSNAQQQEIRLLSMEIAELRESNQALKDYAENADADKDEQAGQLMRYNTVLRQAYKALSRAEIKFCYLANKKNYLECKEAIKAIIEVTSDALLGGKNNEN